VARPAELVAQKANKGEQLLELGALAQVCIEEYLALGLDSALQSATLAEFGNVTRVPLPKHVRDARGAFE
jgi:hypothetical protein